MKTLIEEIEEAILTARILRTSKAIPGLEIALSIALSIIRSRKTLELVECEPDDVEIGQYYVALKEGLSPRFLRYEGTEFRERYQSIDFPHIGYTLYRLPPEANSLPAKEDK